MSKRVWLTGCLVSIVIGLGGLSLIFYGYPHGWSHGNPISARGVAGCAGLAFIGVAALAKGRPK
jgi:hypothetical protein